MHFKCRHLIAVTIAFAMFFQCGFEVRGNEVDFYATSEISSQPYDENDVEPVIDNRDVEEENFAQMDKELEEADKEMVEQSPIDQNNSSDNTANSEGSNNENTDDNSNSENVEGDSNNENSGNGVTDDSSNENSDNEVTDNNNSENSDDQITDDNNDENSNDQVTDDNQNADDESGKDSSNEAGESNSGGGSKPQQQYPKENLDIEFYDSGTITVDGSNIYANGTTIVIKADEADGSTYIYDEIGNKLIQDAVDGKTIYGGGDSPVEYTNITLESGSVSNIIGGGNAGEVSGQANVTINGGNVTGLICGGGRSSNTGSVNITVSNGSSKWLYGGGYEGDVLGDIVINITGGSFTYISGGGFKGNTQGDITMVMENVTVSGSGGSAELTGGAVFGGGWRGSVKGDVSVTINSGTYEYVCGGGYLSQDGSNSTVEGSASVTITSGSINQAVFGGGWNGVIKQNSKVNMSGGSAKSVYGGGYDSGVDGKSEVVIDNNAVVSSAVYGGGQKDTAYSKETSVSLLNGSVSWLYGGGWKGKVEGISNVNITDGTVENIAFGGGYESDVLKTNVTINGVGTTKYLYGGGESGKVLESSNIDIKNGTVTSVYGGGRNAQAEVNSSKVTINNGNITYLYGGGNSGAVKENSEIFIGNGSTVQSAYGGGVEGAVKNSNINLNGGTVTWLYGGGKDGSIDETATINIYDGKISNNIFGGGRSEKSSVKNAVVNINGGEVLNVFAGGDKGIVTEKADITVDTEKTIKLIYGGGYSGSTNNSEITVKNGIITALYGGGYNGSVNSSAINVINGHISQLVAGGAKAEHTVENAALNISGGLVEQLYAGYKNNFNFVIDGGSILTNSAGAAVNSEKNNVYRTIVTVGLTPVKNTAVQFQLGSKIWSSKTDGNGQLIVYIPAESNDITVADGINFYTGNVTTDSSGASVVTLITSGEQIEVNFGIKEGNGVIKAQANGVNISSGAKAPTGAKLTFTAENSDGYYFTEWEVGGNTYTDNPYTIENALSDVNVLAVFKPINKDALKTAIDTAKASINGIKISSDGKDVEPSEQWVTLQDMNSFKNAISLAETIYSKTNTTQSEIDSAVNEMNLANDSFNSAKKYGQKDPDKPAVDKTKLNSLILTAEDEKKDIVISSDGSDVNTDKYWVTQNDIDKLNSAIELAKSAASNAEILQADVDKATAALQSAIDDFKSSKKQGLKQEVIITFSSTSGGSISASSAGNAITSPYTAAVGETIIFAASPNEGWSVQKWEKDGAALSNTGNSLTLEVDSAADIKVYFESEEYAVNFVSDGNGTVSATAGGAKINSGDKVNQGTEVIITAAPNDGYTFQAWYSNNQTVDVKNPFVKNVDGNIDVKAVFKSKPVDKSNLETAINDAKAAINNISVSVDGSDISTDKLWVTRNNMNTFQSAISHAEGVYNSSSSTQSDIDLEVTNINNAKNAFDLAKKYGTNSGTVTVDKIALNNTITEANSVKASVVISSDGLDVSSSSKWVTQSDMDSFNNAISNAIDMADNVSAAQSDIDKAQSELKNAIDSFKNAQKDGLKKESFDLVFGSGENGSISATVNGVAVSSPYTVSSDDILVFIAKPDEGYSVYKWTKNSMDLSENSNTIYLSNVNEDINIMVSFKENKRAYGITVDEAENGLIYTKPIDSAMAGDTVEVYVLPDDGYKVVENSLKYNDNIILGNSFVMPSEDVVITAQFETLSKTKYRLVVEAGAGGSVKGSGSYEEGQEVNISAVPKTGYRFSGWQSSDESIIKDKTSSYTYLVMPRKDVTVKALFERKSSNDSADDNIIDFNPNPNTQKNTQNQKQNIQSTKNISLNGSGGVLIDITARVDSAKTAVVNVPYDNIKSALDMINESSNKNIQINVNSQNEDIKGIYVVIPNNAFDLFEKNSNVSFDINTAMASVAFDQTAISSFSREQNPIQISIINADNISEQAVKAIDGRPVYDISVSSGQKRLSSLGSGNVVISINYALRDGEQPQGVKGCYVDQSGNVSIIEQSKYDENNKVLSMSTNHLSIFGVTYVSDFGNNAEKEQDNVESNDIVQKTFDDIEQHWAKEDIIYMANKGVISGMSDKKFMPDENMSRAMLVTVLGRMSEENIDNSESAMFSDVPEGQYYTSYVYWAFENNIVAGMGDGLFMPDAPIDRQQLAVMIYNYIVHYGIDVEHDLENNDENYVFSDDDNIDYWAKDAVYALKNMGIISGKQNDVFEPKSKATRAEVTSILKRILYISK